MRKCIIAGNWKMNGTKESVRNLLSSIKEGAKSFKNSNLQFVVFPPHVFLDETERQLSGTDISWGAQNFSHHKNGAYTGEISISMLQEFHCRYVLVGHSERRILYGENDDLIASKFVAASDAGLIPILCVGETLDERQSGITNQVINRQLVSVLKVVSSLDVFRNAVIAYEPVWAIGTGMNATKEQAADVHAYIRNQFANYDASIAENLQILYGGSLKPDNASDLLAMEDIDGGLIGGASLKADDFLKIAEKRT